MTTLVTYIGKRETYRDGIFETGAWTRGETKPINDDVALKMFRHPDQYKLAGAEDESSPPGSTEPAPLGKLPENNSKPKEDENAQDLRDSVAAMDKEALTTFAKTHFSVDLHHNTGVEKARAKVIGLIDQFGIA